jgi:hypothetical protein
MRTFRLLGLGLAVLGACRDSSHTSPPPQAASASPSASPSVPAPSASAADDDDGCMAVTSSRHPDPARLLSEYLEHNGRGEFMATSEWHDAAVECPGHTPGWDGATLVTRWATAPLDRRSDTARFVVTYQRAGRITQDSAGLYIAVDPGIQIDTLVFVHRPYGWRLGGSEEDPRVLPGGARRSLTRPADLRLLDSLVAAPSAGSGSGT